MLAFALVWLASGYGAAAVALTSTLAVLPRVGFLLLGGVLGDRHGPTRTLLLTYSLQVLLLLALVPLSAARTPSVGLLAATALCTGVLAALSQPAATVLPRLLLDREDQLPRALAQISASTQLARILGVPLAGALIATGTLTSVLALNAGTVAFALSALLSIRPRTAAPQESQAGTRASIMVELLDGLRGAVRLGVWRLLVAVALVCAAVLPSIAVLVPLTARARGWTATDAARIDAAWAVGILAITLLISLTSTLRRPRAALLLGPITCALGLIGLAAATTPGVATAAAVLVGAGTAMFTTHVAPALIRLAPRDQLSRFQSLLGMVQLLPAAVSTAPYATLGHWQPSAGLAVAALLAATAAAVGVRALHGTSSH